NPKLPDGWGEITSRFDDKTRTFLECITLLYKEYLKEIAAKSTRPEQKTALLSLHIQELTWRAGEKIARDAKHVDAWAHFVKGTDWFEAYPKTEWNRLLIARWMTSLVIGSWLIVIGERLYQLEKHLEPALDLFQEYHTELKTMEVGMRDLMLQKKA